MRWLSVILAIGALLFGAAFVTAPFFAFRAFQAAAQAEDVAALNELVDFEQLRESLTRQVAPDKQVVQTAEPPSIWRNPFEVFKHAIAPLTAPPPQVDRYMTPAGLSALSRGYEPGHAVAEPVAVTTKDKLNHLLHPNWPKPTYWGPNRVRITVTPPNDKSRQTVFTFQRKTLLGWKLVHIGLPKPEAKSH